MKVIKVDVVDPGEGFTSPPTVVFRGGGLGAAATATLDEFGKVKEITVTEGGVYHGEPTVYVEGGGGTGARAKAKIG